MRYAAEVKLIRSCNVKASACASLVACLPALEGVALNFFRPIRDDLRCLLDALAWCPHLKALDLSVECFENSEGDDDLIWPVSYARACANLSSLTKLALAFNEEDCCSLFDVVGALVPLTGLLELTLSFSQPGVVPVSLGRFKLLQSLTLSGFSPCVLKAGCLALPNLLSLEFTGCDFTEDADELPGIANLQRLTRIKMSGDEGPRFFDPQLVLLSKLQHLVLSCDIDDDEDVASSAPARPLRLPADMGVLGLSLLHLDISGLRLPHVQLALTQLVALQDLNACGNEFSELPAGITALSGLKELRLGRVDCPDNFLQVHEKRPMNAVALGDLSGFTALCNLTFEYCEVNLCMSVRDGAARHRSLTSLFFHYAHPAPECAPMVLQLSQDLRRSSVVKLRDGDSSWDDCPAAALPPFFQFKTALELCAL